MKIKRKGYIIRKLEFLFLAIIMGVSGLYGCIEKPAKPGNGFFEKSATGNVMGREIIMDDFILVWPKNGDTFDTLAAKYLGDSDKGWLIAKFNAQNQLYPGKPLIIPLKKIYLGGLAENSYQKVPILVYHQFSDEYSDKLTVKTENFYEQMRFLKDNGYKVIGLDQLLDFMEFQSPLPEKAVVITIDDGWISAFTIAYPILKKFGFTATLFIYTGFIGGDMAMNWSQVKEMAENGFDIQSHTHSYQSLTMARENDSFKNYFNFLIEEIENSKIAIRKHLNRECRYLAYPYGETNPLVVSLVKKMGYRAAFTVTRGGTPFFENPYTIGRSIIYGDFGMDEFFNKISYKETISFK